MGKKKWMKLGLLGLVSFLFVGCTDNAIDGKDEVSNERVNEIAVDATIRETTYGLGKGKKENEVLIWQGIPYGGDTSGENRWKAREDPESWQEPLETTESGEVAIQSSAEGGIGSEDS